MNDVERLKQSARGRWAEILPAVCGIDPAVLDGRHHPCPRCGGVDRFRAFNDFAETGGLICSQCFSKNNGDGLSAVQWLLDIDFPTACKLVAEHLGIAKGNSKVGPKRIVARYPYRDEVGQLLFEVLRYEPKSFKQRKPKPGGGWIWSVKGVRQVPYRLPELLADPERIVFVCEGEKDVDRLAKLGLVATSNAKGAGNWSDAHSAFLAGRGVVVLADNDEEGRKHAQKVATSLQSVAKAVRIVELPNLPHKGDLCDWLDNGGTKDGLIRLMRETPDWSPSAQP